MPAKKRYNLADYKQKLHDRYDPDTWEIEGPDGQIFEMTSPQLWDDDRLAKLSAAEATKDVVAVGQAWLGRRYEAWVRAGGTAMLLTEIIQDHEAASSGESSRPSS